MLIMGHNDVKKTVISRYILTGFVGINGHWVISFISFILLHTNFLFIPSIRFALWTLTWLICSILLYLVAIRIPRFLYFNIVSKENYKTYFLLNKNTFASTTIKDIKIIIRSLEFRICNRPNLVSKENTCQQTVIFLKWPRKRNVRTLSTAINMNGTIRKLPTGGTDCFQWWNPKRLL